MPLINHRRPPIAARDHRACFEMYQMRMPSSSVVDPPTEIK
jgi:hypothetical protein